MRPFALKHLWRWSLLLISSGAFSCGLLTAQDRTVVFDTGASGVTRAIENWGLDVTWPSYDNIRRGIIFMSPQEVDTVRVAFLVNAPLQDGDLTDAQRAELNVMADLASLAGAGKPWTMSPGTGAGVDAWYKDGDAVIPSPGVIPRDGVIPSVSEESRRDRHGVPPEPRFLLRRNDTLRSRQTASGSEPWQY